jgi:hypothetical protein
MDALFSQVRATGNKERDGQTLLNSFNGNEKNKEDEEEEENLCV